MSCLTSPLEFFEDTPAMTDKENLVDLEYFDYPEVSDTILAWRLMTIVKRVRGRGEKEQK